MEHSAFTSTLVNDLEYQFGAFLGPRLWALLYLTKQEGSINAFEKLLQNEGSVAIVLVVVRRLRVKMLDAFKLWMHPLCDP